MLATPVRRAALTAGASLCALVLATSTAHADLAPDQLRAVTDHYLYETSLDEFHTLSTERPHPAQLDWNADSCTWSPDHPWGYDFAISCDRHDFGYRNYPKQGRFTEANRLRIDNNFRDDLAATCGHQRACRATADLYYFAVRKFGGISRSTADALRKAGITPHKTANQQGKASAPKAEAGAPRSIAPTVRDHSGTANTTSHDGEAVHFGTGR